MFLHEIEKENWKPVCTLSQDNFSKYLGIASNG